MKNIILCGGEYKTDTPRHLWKIGKETILGRTMRLLYSAGIDHSDAIVMTNNPEILSYCSDVGYLWMKNPDNTFAQGGDPHWVSWVLPDFPEPVTYIFGDVVFTEDAIDKIIGCGDHRSATFFASTPPFSGNYIKPWAEPFAFKVYDKAGFYDAAMKVRTCQNMGLYPRVPIAWELWHMYCSGEVLHDIRDIDYSSIMAINDGTCDVDSEADLKSLETMFSSYVLAG